MANSYLPLLKGIGAALKADTTLAALVSSRVYSDTPVNPTFPFVTVSIASSDFSAKDFTGMDHTVTCRVYSRLNSPNQCAAIRAAIYNKLNRTPSGVTLDSGTLSILDYNGVSNIALDADGVTWDGLIQFRAVVT